MNHPIPPHISYPEPKPLTACSGSRETTVSCHPYPGVALDVIGVKLPLERGSKESSSIGWNLCGVVVSTTTAVLRDHTIIL